MTDRLTTHLESMRTAAFKAVDFMAGMPLQAFMEDAKTQAATAMCLVIIGEAANKISADAPDFVAGHPDWPWSQVRGLRNRIVHGYDTLDVPVIWSTVTDFVPHLLSAIVAEIGPATQ
jgi:uncharacterized protein with HEPN domain